MTKDRKQCRFCKRFGRYYIKEYKTFQKADLGWCCEKRECVGVADSCESYVYKPRQVVIRRGTQRFLDDILTQLSALRYIIEEEKNEEM